MLRLYVSFDILFATYVFFILILISCVECIFPLTRLSSLLFNTTVVIIFRCVAGGMTLYIKPGPDGTSIGDCPFAHFVRIVLAEKGLEYDVVPTSHETKPQWFIDDYSGKLPALRHRKECYVDSDVIAQYLDFFFPEPSLSADSSKMMEEATAAVEGFFLAMARYVKHRPNGDDEDTTRREELEVQLRILDNYLLDGGRGDKSDDGEEDKCKRTGPYLVGDGTTFTLLDCSMAPKLYAMDVCLNELKKEEGGSINLSKDYPMLRQYMDAVFDRPSFKSTVEYGPQTIVWGWTSHLN